MRVRKQPLPSLSNAQQQVPKLTCILQKRAAIFLQYQSTCQGRNRWESIVGLPSLQKQLRRALIKNLQVSGADWSTSELRYGLLPLTRRGLSSVCEPFLGGACEPDAGFDFSSVRFGIGIIAGLTLLFAGPA